MQEQEGQVVKNLSKYKGSGSRGEKRKFFEPFFPDNEKI